MIIDPPDDRDEELSQPSSDPGKVIESLDDDEVIEALTQESAAELEEDRLDEALFQDLEESVEEGDAEKTEDL
jgi:hypothetical protein